MKTYGISPKSGSRQNRIGSHGDDCICKFKKVNKKAARRRAKKEAWKEQENGRSEE